MQCLICDEIFDESQIVKLNCGHIFCLIDLHDYVKQRIALHIQCPRDNCNRAIEENVIRNLLSESDIVKFENNLISISLCGESVHKCLLEECENFAIYEDENIQYDCTHCSLYNCIKCEAPHKHYTCNEYRNLSNEQKIRICQEQKEKHRKNLVSRRKLEILTAAKKNILQNDEPFFCDICSSQIKKRGGVKLKECFHCFCRPCLNEAVLNRDEYNVKCFANGCKQNVTSAEIFELLNDLPPDQRKAYNIRESGFISSALGRRKRECQSNGCSYLVDADEEVKYWQCRLCSKFNCELCHKQHSKDEICSVKALAIQNRDKEYIDQKVADGSMMACLKCKTYLTKISGCNWVQCGNCKLEICWINKIERWGPAGRGDNSGGCRCGVNDKRCHPNCVSTCDPH